MVEKPVNPKCELRVECVGNMHDNAQFVTCLIGERLLKDECECAYRVRTINAAASSWLMIAPPHKTLAH